MCQIGVQASKIKSCDFVKEEFLLNLSQQQYRNVTNYHGSRHWDWDPTSSTGSNQSLAAVDRLNFAVGTSGWSAKTCRSQNVV